LKLNTLVMIQTKFGFHWSSTFRGEDFWKSLRRTTDDNDGRQVMRIAHMTLWVRWAKKWFYFCNRLFIYFTIIKTFYPFWILIFLIYRQGFKMFIFSTTVFFAERRYRWRFVS
jgi:hypothetical protein